MSPRAVQRITRHVRDMARVQNLIGKARSAYENDRNPDRSRDVVGALNEAFDLMVELRKNHQVIDPGAS